MNNHVYPYTIEKAYYTVRPLPGYPGMREHSFYIKAMYMPFEVPHGCNPRFQNIDKPAYAPVRDSFLDKTEMFFHLKNRGITVLANEVSRQDIGDWMILHVSIPPELGDVDGHHSYEIVSKYRKENPEQMIGVRILEKLPEDHISPVAQGLNTSVQVKSDSLSNQRGRFDLVKKAVMGKPYENWIAWVENQPNTSVPAKTILSLMWVCNPLLYKGKSEKHPNWIYSRAQAVFENGFHRNDDIRNTMLKMAEVMPQLIDIYMLINERTHELSPKQRRFRGKLKDITGEFKKESNIASLCVLSNSLHFRDPAIKDKFKHLREPYAMIFMSGLRSLLRENPNTGILEWAVDDVTLMNIVNSVHKKIMQIIVKQFKHDGGNHVAHGITPRQPSLWNAVEAEMGREIAPYIVSKKGAFPGLPIPPKTPLPVLPRRN